MCGISGSIQGGGDQKAHIEQQLCLLRHRGPDSEGAYERLGACVGQTRLAVIDLLTGDPPVTNEDGTIGVALNGELYNYRMLRRELRPDHEFRTEGDTEVIAHLAEDHDPVALTRRLDGMFAFALWDDRHRRLVLGRDRLGKKPLYYWAHGGTLVFASEIKAVLAHSAVPRRLNERALPAYLSFGYVPTPHTFFDGVRSLPPAHVLTMEPGRSPVVESYWQPPTPGMNGVEPLHIDLSEAAVSVRKLLGAAVDRRLIADVPVGAFLSGGIDSSSVVALMASASSRPVSTFTIGFEDGEGYDERPAARMVAERFGTDHTEFVVKPNATELAERLVWHHDQPFGDSSALPTFLLSELTREHVTVALCGDGGDDIFGGYERFAAARIRHRLEVLPRPLRAALDRLARALPAGSPRGKAHKVRRLLGGAERDLLGAYLSWVSYVPPEWCEALLPGSSHRALDDYATTWQQSRSAGLLDRLLHLNLRTYLLDDLLPKVDRMSMAHGLEVRSPFLDTALLEFALRLPDAVRVRGLSLKRVVKEAMRDILPEEILHRPKHGFGVPLDRWFRTELSSYIEQLLCGDGARTSHHLSLHAVRGLVAEHQRGTANHGQALWTLLTLELFLRREGW
ncbi:MAG: asparagine synthase (glutamine-hydrolyzing) [Actinomycetota bacterium]|nr:asparagine synthase (glutamine-hydrolyzing) [Actinomycetota bacterium]